MESVTPSDFSGDAEKLLSAPPFQPKVSSSSTSVSDEIPTPEKLVQLPRQAGKRSLSFAVIDVRRITMGLPKTHCQVANSQDHLILDSEPLRKSESRSDSIIAKLPDNYEMLAEFFNCLDSSIRLLRLKGMLPTFTNISTSVQNLTERRFTYKHLAQLKHILPESISIKKVLLRDEATSCMKPELLVSLQVDTLQSKVKLKGKSAYSALKKVFRSRLFQFAREHPEENEIPEGTLPHPYGHRKQSMSTKSNESISSVLAGSSTLVNPVEKLTIISHFSGSFKRRFSQKNSCSDEMKSPLVCLSGKKPLKVDLQEIEEDSKMFICSRSSPSRGKISSESTPVKEISTPIRLMSTTPELQTPKRSYKCTNDDTPQKELVKRGVRTRLFPTTRKNAKFDGVESFSESSPVEDDVLGFLPQSLLQDIKEKERIAMEEMKTIEAGEMSRKKMIATLPKLLNSILLIFQSGDRSVITKQELVHKILSSHYNVIDRNEVEEQLELMQELVPDWISQITTLTGGILYRLNKTSNAQEIRQRLAVAE